MDDRLLQRRHPATGNAQSPTVDNRVRRIASCMDDDDGRPRRLESARSWMWSEIHCLQIHFKSTAICLADRRHPPIGKSVMSQIYRVRIEKN